MEKIKQFLENEQGKDVLTILIITLVGFGSFGLGRLSKEVSNPGITVKEYNLANVEYALSPTVNTPKTPKNQNVFKSVKNYFGSSRGSKYYSIGCTGGKTLKEENKIWFASKEEAEKAGYELSSTCKQ